MADPLVFVGRLLASPGHLQTNTRGREALHSEGASGAGRDGNRDCSVMHGSARRRSVTVVAGRTDRVACSAQVENTIARVALEAGPEAGDTTECGWDRNCIGSE